MELKVVRGPFMLHETVDMLYKFVNGLFFRSLLNQRVSVQETMSEVASQRTETTFAPNVNITRAQLASILMRYCEG